MNDSVSDENPFKRALAKRATQIGLWSSLCSHLVAEVLAGSGFDWIVIDSEHGPNELGGIIHQLQAMGPYPVEPVVRLPIADAVAIKRFLDAGARTLLFPMVQNEEEAAAIVAATRYPPAGIRGVAWAHRGNRFGRVPNYLSNAADSICVLVQAETVQAVKNLEAMAAVPGIDGIFIGPSDLAAALGHLGNPAHPDVQAVIADAVARGNAAGKAMGILTANKAEAQRYLELGFTFVAVGSDVGILARESEALAAAFRPLKKPGA